MSTMLSRIELLTPEKQELVAARLDPASFGQQRLWFLDQLQPGNPAYHIFTGVRLEGELDVEALAGALTAVVRRHAVLRTSFPMIGRRLVQLVHPPEPFRLERVDLSAMPSDRRKAEVLRLARLEFEKPFDLRAGPLLRARLLRLGEREHVFLLTIHHVVFDGWSRGIFLGELAAHYRAAREGTAAELPDLPLQYGDYARWQRQWLTGEELERQIGFWKGKLEGAPSSLPLPFDRPRSRLSHARGGHLAFQVGPELAEALRAVCRRYEVTPFMLLLAAFKVLLGRYCGTDDVSVGTPVAGRPRPELERLVGFFINTLVLRTDLSGNPRFSRLLERVRAGALDAYAHQDLPFEKLVDELQPERDLGVSPLFQVMFSLQSAPAEDGSGFPGLRVTPLDAEASAPQFDLTLGLTETEGAFRGSFDFNRDLFDESTIRRLAAHYRNLLEAVAAAPETRVRDLPLLAAPERRQLVAGWNDTARDYADRDRPLHELIEAQAARTPDAAAVRFEGAELTYAELDRRAEHLAARLAARGVGPDSVVGVCAERSVEMVVALVGILKAGAAYLPLDPENPPARLKYMLDKSGARVVLVQRSVAEAIEGGDYERIDLAEACADSTEDVDRNRPTVSPENAAYVIYTSGTTGLPKGVMVPHRGIVNRLLWMQEAFGLEAGERVLQKTPYTFDVSVWEFFWPLITGATLVVARPGGHRDPDYLVELIGREAVSTLHFVPSMLNAFLQARGVSTLDSLRRVICSGEALGPDQVERFYQIFTRDETALHNLYGPTEASVDVSWWACPRGETPRVVPIGRPVANTALYVLGEAMEPVPVGVAGELYIGGIQLARGYAADPRQTAARFVPSPFRSGERLYRTGDRARLLADGAIEYLGRADHQLKIRGFRIEPGEIEHALAAHPRIAQAAVIPIDRAGHVSLAAYVVAEGEAPSVSEMREHLKARVPEYMVPAHFVVLDAMPLTTSGKVDRKALPKPGDERPELEAAYEQPEDEVQRQLAEIWSRLLGVERVGVNDNFFELGGDSILSIQVVARAAEAGIRLTPRQMFEHQTIARLAAVAGQGSAVAAEQGPVTGEVPLTPIQHWFFELGLRNPNHWNQSLMLRGDGALDTARLGTLFRALAAHHDALRTRFVRDGDGWRQETGASADQAVRFTDEDLSHVDPSEERAEIEARAAALQESLDLENGPLFAAAYLQLRDGWRLVLAAHHLVVDGVSWRILLDDLQKGYRQLEAGGDVDLGPKTTSFQFWSRRLARHVEEGRVDAEVETWADARRLDAARIPLDRDGENVERSTRAVEVTLTREETDLLLREVPRVYKARIDEVLLAAAASALVQWAGGRGGVLIDLEGHGREEIFEEVDLSRTVGWLTSLYPVYLAPPDPWSGGAPLLKAVKEELRRVPNNGIGYGLLRYLPGSRHQHRLAAVDTPQVAFNYLGQLDRVLGEESLFAVAPESAGGVRGPDEVRTHVLEIVGSISGGQLSMRWRYSANLHDERSVAAAAETFRARLLEFAEGTREPEAEAFTPSDFSRARVSQEQLDKLLGKLKV